MQSSVGYPGSVWTRLDQKASSKEDEEEDCTEDERSDDILIISPSGDIVLKIQHDQAQEQEQEAIQFRCDSTCLKEASSYFRELLGSTSFREGKALANWHAELRSINTHMGEVPAGDLPLVEIKFFGEVAQMKSKKELMTYFLLILHDYDVPRIGKHLPDVTMACIAVLADRFDCVLAVKRWAQKRDRKLLRRDLVKFGKNQEALCRQRLLTSLIFFEKPPLLSHFTYCLIMEGSVMWRSENSNGSATQNVALWWEVPRGIEEEMQFRRGCILQTLDSLQSYIISLYTSKERKCRLGYDSSPQCDSFQLGELVRHLSRLGMLQFQNPLSALNVENGYEGSILKLIQDLRAFPSYQIDANHTHCGPKKLLTAGLDTLKHYIGERQIGICSSCLEKPGQGRRFWSEVEDRKTWPIQSLGHFDIGRITKDLLNCSQFIEHEAARNFFTTDEIAWDSLVNRDGQRPNHV